LRFAPSKRAKLVTWSCLAPQGARSVWLEGRVDVRKRAGKATRWKGSWVVPPFFPEWDSHRGGGRWNDPGQASKPSLDCAKSADEAGATGRLGTESGGARGRHEDSRGRDDFGECSSSRRKRRPSARGSHPERREALPHRTLRTRFQWTYGEAGAEGASRLAQPKRAPANSSAHPSWFRPRERLWSKEGFHSPRWCAVTKKGARAHTAKSVFSRKG